MKLRISIALIALLMVGCQSHQPIEDYDFFYEHQPETILVLPVINQTTSAEAPHAFMSTIGSPLLQRGYYVLPPVPSIDVMAAEGIYEGDQLVDVTPAKYEELLGADSILYITIHSWDTYYLILASGVEVSMTYELIDTATGETLWVDSATRSIQSDTSGGLVSALVNAAITAAAVEYVPLAQQANLLALTTLPPGPYSRNFDKAREGHLTGKKADKYDPYE